MTGRRPAIRDTVLSIRAETETITLVSTVVRWRCGRCAFEWERHHAEGVPSARPPASAAAVPAGLTTRSCPR